MQTLHSRRQNEGFTLIELLVAIVVLALLMGIILQAITSVQRVTALSAGNLTAFQEARFGYDELTSKLGQATLNTYWDYNSQTAPTTYQRASELHFLCGVTTGTAASTFFSSAGLFTSGGPYPTSCIFFESPLGVTQSASYSNLENLLNASGYYVEFGSDTSDLPSFLSTIVAPRWRFRLKEWQPSSENFPLYQYTSGVPTYDAATWINLSTASNIRTLALNIIALIVLPKLSTAVDATGAQLSPDYFYDSRTTMTTDVRRNQLPPLVQVIMVAIDEPSAIKLAAKNGSTMPHLFPTSPQLFTQSANLQQDLATLEGILAATPGNATGNTIPLNYIVMNSDVNIHAAKWSAF